MLRVRWQSLRWYGECTLLSVVVLLSVVDAVVIGVIIVNLVIGSAVVVGLVFGLILWECEVLILFVEGYDVW